MRAFEAISDTLCIVGACFAEKFLRAKLQAAAGNDQRAAEILDRWGTSGGALPSAVLAALERGRIAERLGDHRMALDRYRFVTETWRKADPQLQLYVAEAQHRCGGLARERCLR
jgi:hypothetical protein